MGQKVHPEVLRVGYIHDWKSQWFNEREFSDYLLEDIRIREHIEGKLSHAGLSSITIRKDKNEVEVNIHTARPGIVIGKSGTEVDALRRAEMARTEGYSDGRVPLHTLRADIDYGFFEARTTFGRIGVKVWINKGEIMPSGFAQDLTQMEAPQQAAPGGGGGGDRDSRGGRGGR